MEGDSAFALSGGESAEVLESTEAACDAVGELVEGGRAGAAPCADLDAMTASAPMFSMAATIALES